MSVAVVRFLFALLLGFVLGAGGTLYLVNSGAVDLIIRKTAMVEDLEHKLRDAETQRDQLARQFEDFARRSEARFGELEQRFREIDRDHPRDGAPRPTEAPRGAETP
jgi:hypothetical protein